MPSLDPEIQRNANQNPRRLFFFFFFVDIDKLSRNCKQHSENPRSRKVRRIDWLMSNFYFFSTYVLGFFYTLTDHTKTNVGRSSRVPLKADTGNLPL